MLRFIKNAFMSLVLLAIVIFAGTNMKTVSLEIDPLGLGLEALRPVEAPLAFVILGVLLIGLVFGVFFMRLASWPVYRERNRQKREIQTLRRELEKLQETLKEADHPESVAMLPSPRR